MEEKPLSQNAACKNQLGSDRVYALFLSISNKFVWSVVQFQHAVQMQLV